ncbi:octopamine receptor-like [Schistocerca serialis cubense]|uniref:octopamine receptor-like n=1 Tax=Schistocerca serialis cubense TaxID=2023355 RepID=UPI00214E236F|nr:octopamine receptor-like [Schistocerca serialis cubense]
MLTHVCAGKWHFGWQICQVWISLDVLLCTASILSLCAISVDRYLAVTQPLNYSRRRRSKKLALLMILVVWVLAVAITCPPILGWYDKTQSKETECRYSRNQGYVIFSATGSFYLPLAVMLYVYARISCVIARRHSQLTGGVDAQHQRNSRLVSNQDESDMERASSECEDGHIRCTSLMSPGVLEFGAGTAGTRSLRAHYLYCTPQTCAANADHNHAHAHSAGPASARSSFYGRASRPLSLALDVPSMETAALQAGLPHVSSRVSSFRRESKTAQTLSIVVGGFIACWLPFFICYILLPWVHIAPPLMIFLTWLGWINSAINPFIYAFYSPDFRIAFWRLTLRHCSKPRRPQDPSIRHK